MEEIGSIVCNDEEAVEDDTSELSSESDDDDSEEEESDEGSLEGTGDNEDNEDNEENDEGESETDDSSSSDNDREQHQDAEDDTASSSPDKKPKRKAAEIESDSSSDDDHENGERTPKCPICLNRLSKSLVASPDSGCIHNFCLECLREWSKNNNTCPIDRSEFYNIIIKSNISGEELTREEVIREKPTEFQEHVEVTLCEVCGSGDREESLLLCDGCDLGYHLECCNPPLQRVPRGLWYCMICSAAGLISDYIRLGHRLDRADDRENGFESQALPRTMIIERIRRVIRGRQVNGAGAGPSRPIRKRRKTRRKRKTPKKRQTAASSSLTGKPKHTRRKSKKRKLSKKVLRKKEKREKRRQERKDQRDNREREHHALTLFGRANDLDFYGDEELFVCPESGSTSGLASNLPSTSVGCSNSTVASVEQQMNILEDILNAQSSFFSETTTCRRTERTRNEIYTRPDLDKEKPAPDGRPYLVASASKNHQSGISSRDDRPDSSVPENSNSYETLLESPSDSGSPKFSSSTTGATQWRPTEIKAANRFHLGSFRIPRRHADPVKKEEEESSEEFLFKVPSTKQKNVEEATKRPATVEDIFFSEEPRRSWKKSRSSDHDSRSDRDKEHSFERSHHVEKSRHRISEHHHHHTNSRLPSTSSSRKHARDSPTSTSQPDTVVKGNVTKERHESRTSRTRSHKEKESTDRPDTSTDQGAKTAKVTDPDTSDRPSHSSSESKSTSSKTRHKRRSSTSPQSEKPQDLPGFVIHLVKLALAPHYQSKAIPKDVFKVIVRKSSDKVLSREKSISSVQEARVRQLVEAYVDRYKRKGKV